MSILNSRKADNLNARRREYCNGEEIVRIINRSFEAGVAARSDADFAALQDSLDRARARFEAQKKTQPVAVIDVAPGNLIRIATNEF
jgi:outer membrane protein TolC